MKVIKSVFISFIEEDELLKPLRERILRILLISATAIGFLPLTYMGYASWQRGVIQEVYPYIVLYIVVLVPTLLPKLDMNLRFSMLLMVGYVFGIIELAANGLSGDGRLIMMIIVGSAGVFLGIRAAMLAMVITLLTQFVFGFGMSGGWIQVPNQLNREYSLSLPDWVMANLVFLMLGAMLIASTFYLVWGTVNALRRQQQLSKDLENERNLLKERVDEQTAELRQEIGVRTRAEEVLRESEQRFRTLFESSTVPIALLRGLKFLLANPAVVQLLGYKSELDLENRDVFDFIAPDARQLLQQELNQNKTQIETTGIRADGSFFFCEIAVSTIQLGDGPATMVFIADITERRHTQNRLEYMSTHDALTGLFNRAYFETELHRMNANPERPVTILMIDVNDLKRTNDERGHYAGDALLKNVAAVLQASFRDTDIIARIGGDEFAVLLPRTGTEKTPMVLNRVMTSLMEFNLRMVDQPPISIAQGFATGEAGSNLMEVLHQADEAMYANKARQKQANHL